MFMPTGKGRGDQGLPPPSFWQEVEEWQVPSTCFDPPAFVCPLPVTGAWHFSGIQLWLKHNLMPINRNLFKTLIKNNKLAFGNSYKQKYKSWNKQQQLHVWSMLRWVKSYICLLWSFSINSWIYIRVLTCITVPILPFNLIMSWLFSIYSILRTVKLIFNNILFNPTCPKYHSEKTLLRHFASSFYTRSPVSAMHSSHLQHTSIQNSHMCLMAALLDCTVFKCSFILNWTQIKPTCL